MNTAAPTASSLALALVLLVRPALGDRGAESGAARASADARPGALAAGAAPVPPATDLVVRGGLGAGSSTPIGGVLSATLELGVRRGLVQGGFELTGDTEVFGGDYSSAGVMAGLGFRSAHGVRLELLGTGGIGRWHGVGCGLFCTSGGASGSLPYLGARAGIGYVFGRRRGHFLLGVAGHLDEYLGSEEVSYSSTTSNLLGPGTSTNVDTREFSGSRTALLATFGAVIDL